VEEAPLSERTIDAGIIGGGPAGTMAAIEAVRNGLETAIWDRGTFPRDKVCGEFLSPEALPLLRQVIPETICRSVPIRRAEFCSKRGRIRSIAFPEHGAGLSRLVLDHALWQAAQRAGARCYSHQAVLAVERGAPEGEAAWQITPASRRVKIARRLIVTCGRWWKLSGLASPAGLENKRRAGEWLGAKAHFRGIEAIDAVEMYFFPGGYCGLAPVEDGAYNACCLVDRNLARSCGGSAFPDFRMWISKIAGHTVLDSRLRKAVQISPTVTTAPVRPAKRASESSGILIAGDAAGFLDPFTGDGISIALHSGQLAARQLAEGFEGSLPLPRALRYRRQVSRAVRRSYACASLLRGMVRAPAALQDWLAAAIPSFICSRLMSETRWRDFPMR
jgi:menaquinone-9 beta-reductase